MHTLNHDITPVNIMNQQSQLPKFSSFVTMMVIALTLGFFSTTSLADPQNVTLITPSNMPTDTLPITQPLPRTQSPTTSQIQTNATSSTQAGEQNPKDTVNKNVITPEMIPAGQAPSIQQLSQANQQLLTQNASMQRRINDLDTQVNVLINERSGQLFLYGVITVIFSFFAGLVIAFFIMKQRNDRW